eukprot:754426-Hanusia_phi.AAC.3
MSCKRFLVRCQTHTAGCVRCHGNLPSPQGDGLARKGGAQKEGLRIKNDEEQAQLYELIFQRTLASVMCDAELDLTSVDILGEVVCPPPPSLLLLLSHLVFDFQPADRSRDSATFRATGRVIRKHGWMLAYLDSSDEQQGDTQRLPFLQSDQVSYFPSSLSLLPCESCRSTPRRWSDSFLLACLQELLCSELRLDEHSTKPPARYTEATLVKELEELGVGRPSTYTQIIETLKGREYVSMEGKALSPTLIAFVVTRLLETYFRDFIDTSFTARFLGLSPSLS